MLEAFQDWPPGLFRAPSVFRRSRPRSPNKLCDGYCRGSNTFGNVVGCILTEETIYSEPVSVRMTDVYFSLQRLRASIWSRERAIHDKCGWGNSYRLSTFLTFVDILDHYPPIRYWSSSCRNSSCSLLPTEEEHNPSLKRLIYVTRYRPLLDYICGTLYLRFPFQL